MCIFTGNTYISHKTAILKDLGGTMSMRRIFDVVAGADKWVPRCADQYWSLICDVYIVS